MLVGFSHNRELYQPLAGLLWWVWHEIGSLERLYAAVDVTSVFVFACSMKTVVCY